MVEARPAIGGLCVDTLNPSTENLVGTSFAVSTHQAVTAFHCVGNRESGELLSNRVMIWFYDRFEFANVVELLPEIDVAVLELDKGIPEGLEPLTLDDNVSVGMEFHSVGWPAERQFAAHYFAVSGNVVDVQSRIFEDEPALQLYCVQAGTFPLAGFSGAPVQLAGSSHASAAGIIRWNPTRGGTVALAAGSTVYATPASAILERSSRLGGRPGTPPAVDATEPSTGFCISHSNADKDVAIWIGQALREAGFGALVRGEYVRRGANFLPPLLDAHDQYPNVLLILSKTTLQCDSPSHQTELDWMKSGEISGEIIPVRIERVAMPGFVANIEPIDLRGHATELEVKAALLEAFAASGSSMVPVPRFPADKLIAKQLPPVSRSRLSRVTLDGVRQIEGGA